MGYRGGHIRDTSIEQSLCCCKSSLIASEEDLGRICKVYTASHFTCQAILSMLKVTRVIRVLLLLQQICFASCAIARYTVNNNPSSTYTVNNNPSFAGINRLPATNNIRPFNVTTLGNLANGTYSVHDHNAYCTNDPEWLYLGTEDFNEADCEDALKDMLNGNRDIDRRLYWSFPGRNDDDHQETPLKYTSESCVVAVWPRYLATYEDDYIRRAEPVGTQHQDVASFHEIGTLAYRVFEQCMVKDRYKSLGWIPVGDSNSLFVGFWEANSVLDLWSDNLHDTLPPAIAVT